MLRITQIIGCFAIAWIACGAVSAATVDFQPPALGTQFGSTAGHSPGDLVYSQNGVDMTVENFTSGAFVGFNFAEIVGHPGPPTSYFPPAVNPTQALTTNNITARFDFTKLPGKVTKLRLLYADAGDTNNFDVNLLGRQEVNDLTTLGSYPDYNVSVSANPMPGGAWGAIEVVAAPGHFIETLDFGGQESSIDNLVTVPEPASVVAALLGLASVLATRRGRTA